MSEMLWGDLTFILQIIGLGTVSFMIAWAIISFIRFTEESATEDFVIKKYHDLQKQINEESNRRLFVANDVYDLKKKVTELEKRRKR